MPSSILTVTTAATARRLSTEATLRLELMADIEPDAAAVLSLLDQASAAVESWCGRTFARETVSETFRLDAATLPLILGRHPIVAVTGVTEDGVAVVSGDREFDPASGLLWRLSADTRIAWPASKIIVAYSAGYLLPGETGRDLPHDIERAALIVAAGLFAARGRDPLLRSESVDGVSAASWLDPRAGAGGMPAQAAELLAPWRNWRVG